MLRFCAIVFLPVIISAVQAAACQSVIVPSGDSVYIVTNSEVARIKASDLTVLNKAVLPGASAAADVSAVIHGDSLFVLRGPDLFKINLQDRSISGGKPSVISLPVPVVSAPTMPERASGAASTPSAAPQTDTTVYPTSSSLTKSK